MSKMFVHYSGTIDQFKALNNIAEYDNKIVFIKGGADGKGAAIYTHGKYYGDVKDALASLQSELGSLKYFSGIKAGDKTATAAAKDGIIAFNATDPATVAVDVDARGVNIGLSSAFVDKVDANASGLAQEITRATEAEGKLRTDLGTKTDEANAEGSVFARIAKLASDINAMTGGNGSIADQIDAAIKLLDVEAIAGDYVASISQEDGKIVPVMGTFNFDEKGAAAAVLGTDADADTAVTVHGVKKHADKLAAAAAEDATSKANKALEDAKAEIAKLDASVESEEIGKIKVQVVEVDGKVTEVHVTESDIASAEVLAQVKADVDNFFKDALGDSDAQQVKDTLKEIQDYIDSDAEGAGAMTASIKEAKDAADAAQGEVDALETVVAGVKSTAEKAASDLASEIERAGLAEKANADAIAVEKGRVDTIVADYLKAADKTELTTAINGKVAQSDYDTKVAELVKADSDSLAAAKKHADDAIAGLNVTDEAVANQFVTAVSESAGKITVSRSAVNASQINITNTESDAFAAATQNVQDALNELASFWDWEEL